MFDGPDLNPAGLAGFCERGIHIRIETVGNFAFTQESVRNGEGQGDLRTYAFEVGRYFRYITDLNGQFDRQFPDQDVVDIPPARLMGIIRGQTGIARVEMVGADVLMIDGPNTMPRVLVRCP